MIMNVSLESVEMAFAEVKNKGNPALLMRTVMLNLFVKLLINGHIKQLARAMDFMETLVQEISIVTLKITVGISSQQMLALITEYAWRSILRKQGLNLDGVIYMVTVLKMPSIMDNFANLAGLRTQMGLLQLNVLKYLKFLQISMIIKRARINVQLVKIAITANIFMMDQQLTISKAYASAL